MAHDKHELRLADVPVTCWAPRGGAVDTQPNCGDMLSGVAPFAIEHGLVAAQDSKRRNPRTCSSLPIRRLVAGCEMCTASAALQKLEADLAQRPTRSLRGSTLTRLGYLSTITTDGTPFTLSPGKPGGPAIAF